jgi:exosortase/archaeosortase family protein
MRRNAVTAPAGIALISRGRSIVSLFFLACAIGTVGAATWFRTVEAHIAPWVFQIAGLGPANNPQGPHFDVYGTVTPIRFTITTQCGALLLTIPISIAAALLVRSPVCKSRRIFAAAFGADVLLILANQIRLVIIGWCSRLFGFERGFPFGHLVVGSLFSMVAIGISTIGFLRSAKGGAHPLRPVTREVLR